MSVPTTPPRWQWETDRNREYTSTSIRVAKCPNHLAFPGCRVEYLDNFDASADTPFTHRCRALGEHLTAIKFEWLARVRGVNFSGVLVTHDIGSLHRDRIDWYDAVVLKPGLDYAAMAGWLADARYGINSDRFQETDYTTVTPSDALPIQPENGGFSVFIGDVERLWEVKLTIMAGPWTGNPDTLLLWTVPLNLLIDGELTAWTTARNKAGPGGDVNNPPNRGLGTSIFSAALAAAYPAGNASSAVPMATGAAPQPPSALLTSTSPYLTPAATASTTPTQQSPGSITRTCRPCQSHNLACDGTNPCLSCCRTNPLGCYFDDPGGRGGYSGEATRRNSTGSVALSGTGLDFGGQSNNHSSELGYLQQQRQNLTGIGGHAGGGIDFGGGGFATQQAANIGAGTQQDPIQVDQAAQGGMTGHIGHHQPPNQLPPQPQMNQGTPQPQPYPWPLQPQMNQAQFQAQMYQALPQRLAHMSSSPGSDMVIDPQVLHDVGNSMGPPGGNGAQY